MAATSLTSARHEAPTTTMTTPTTATAPSRTARRRSYRFQPWNVGRWLVWGGFALLLVLAPLLWSSSFALTMLSQMGIAIIVCLSYNMLLGQGGMLSFGHAVYSGLGAYLAIHTLNQVGAGTLALPVSLVPLVGGLGGGLFALLLGHVSTRKSGTTFAMITLGVGELVWSMSLMLPEFFGGEGGISSNRVVGPPVLGITFGPQIQVYYLIALYCFVCTALMFAFTRTPLGRMLNAVRDNAERVEFIGYSASRIRWIAFTIAGFFAGIGGGLYVLIYEIVTFDTVSAAKSANALLAVYIGGAGGFFGPVLGTFVVVLLQSGVSLLSNAWLLYVGVLFIVMVMYAPGGLIGLIYMHMPIWRAGRIRELLVPYARALPAALLVLVGFVFLVELTSFTTIGAAQGKKFTIAGNVIDTTAPAPWAIAIACLVVGGLWLRREARGFRVRWDELMDGAKRQEATA